MTDNPSAEELISALPESQQEFFRLAQSKEPLDPELAAWIDHDGPFGAMIKHPLVYDLTGVHTPALANRQLRAKKERLERAREEHDWHTVIYLHERPHRCDALLTLFSEYGDEIDDATFWKLVGSVWVDSENIWQNVDEWDYLLSVNRSGRENIMRSDDDDLDDVHGYEALPDTVTVYRGAIQGQNEEGLSWTTERKTAVWFAKRFADHRDGVPVVLTGTVEKCDVIAFFAGRGESEVVVQEGAVRVEKIEEV